VVRLHAELMEDPPQLVDYTDDLLSKHDIFIHPYISSKPEEVTKSIFLHGG
jgi:hypothetical protein